MADRTIQIIVEINDATGGALGNIQKGLLAMDKAVQRIQNKLRAFATQKYAATVRLIDRVTQPGNRINSFLKSLASKVYNITMRVTDSAGSKIRQIEASLMKLAGRAWTIAVNVRDNIKGKLTGLADGMLMGAGTMGVGMLGTAGIGYSAVNAAQSYMNFEKQMSRVQAVANLDKHDEKMIQLVEKAKEMGATTEWTRAEAAQAEYYMAMAGWSPDKILAALPSVMHLASAGGTDLATTSDVLTDSMTGFRLNAGERYVDAAGRNVEASQHYADMMAKLVTSSNTNIAQLSEALKYSAPVVGAMYSDKDVQTRMHATEDAMVMAGLMANAGIKGSMAGTATRAIFSRFGSENRNAYQALRALNVDFTDENGEVRRIADVMKDVSARFKQGVDPNQLLNFAEAISGEKIHADTRRKLDSFVENTQKHGGNQYNELHEICNESNAWGADLFVSIHCNAGSGTGSETFYYYGSTQGRKLAEAIQKQVIDSIGTVNRRVEARGFAVLSGTQAPAVLVETAFIDNARDARLLVEREDDFARAIARDITDFCAS